MGKNFNGTQINQSPTISEKAGADVADIRNLILKYDTDGNVVVAADGTAPLLGVSIIESGYNDISGVEAGMVKKGEDVDILIKDIGSEIRMHSFLPMPQTHRALMNRLPATSLHGICLEMDRYFRF